MRDLFDLFNDEDYSRVKWDQDDMLVPTDDIADYDIDDLTEIEIPEDTSYSEDYEDDC